MMIDPRLATDIDNGEGCRLTAYRDTKNLWTIGWGHLLDQTKDWTGCAWTQQYADSVRDQDIQTAVTAAQALQEWPYLDTPCRQNAVCELVFNMGEKKWKGFVKCRAAIARGDWRGAHDQLIASEWDTEVGKTRADRIADYLLTGQYPS
jgi:lysozyme